MALLLFLASCARANFYNERRKIYAHNAPHHLSGIYPARAFSPASAAMARLVNGSGGGAHLHFLVKLLLIPAIINMK